MPSVGGSISCMFEQTQHVVESQQHTWIIHIMSKINNLRAESYLKPFRNELGGLFDKMVNDCNAFVGRLEKDIITTQSGWVVGAKGRLVSKEGNILQLPLNSEHSILIQFGLKLQAIADAGSTDEPVYKMDVQSTIPANCRVWIDKLRNTKVTA